MYETTYHGLMMWYKAEIEKLGWMIIFSQTKVFRMKQKKNVII